MIRSLMRTSAIAAVFVASLVFGGAPAFASCIAPPPMDEAIRDADIVFVGTVVGADFGGRVADFVVVEVWKGAVAAETVVTGGPSLRQLSAARARGEDLATSVDRSYSVGETYLVFAFPSDDGTLSDNVCSNTRLFTAELEPLRPDTAFVPEPLATETPEDDSTSDSGLGFGWIVPTLMTVGAVGVAVGVTMATRRRRSRDAAIW